MHDGEQLGFIEWLHKKGVSRMCESDEDFSISLGDSGTLFIIEDAKKAQEIINIINLQAKINISEHHDLSEFYKKRTNLTVHGGVEKYSYATIMYISTEARELLRQDYMAEIHAAMSDKDKANHNSAMINALRIISDQKVTNASSAISENYDTISERMRLSKVVAMLRNKSESGYDPTSISSISKLLNIYFADNYHLLTESARSKVQGVISSFSGKDQNGKIIAGLYTDAVATKDIKTENDSEKVIDQYVEHLLHGGMHSIDLRNLKIHFNAQTNDKGAFRQPRFFYGPNGEPAETNQLVFCAGGALGHSAQRILQRIVDGKSIGGARYIYKN